MDESLVIAVSNISDGSMSVGVSDERRLANRRRFLANYQIDPVQTILVRLEYDDTDYKRYFTVSSGQAGDGIITPSTITVDALFTRERNVALLLPVADCVGAVLYSKDAGVMGLAHLGRHNLVQSGGSAVVRYMVQDFDVDLSEVAVYLSPAAGRERYPLYDFDNRSMHEVATQQLLAAGIVGDNITVDTRDTTKDTSLFSHSEYLKGNRKSDGRQAVVSMMRP